MPGPRYREGPTGESLAELAGSLTDGPNLAPKPQIGACQACPYLPPHRRGLGLLWPPYRSSSPTIASMVSLKTPTAVSPRRLSSNVHR